MRVCVRDTGPGLSGEQLAQLFQPFNRLNKQPNVDDGTGIGLAICKRLVALMGGTMGADSTPGVGSIFWIELNLEGMHHD
jgi:signal transduction histidine kinase